MVKSQRPFTRSHLLVGVILLVTCLTFVYSATNSTTTTEQSSSQSSSSTNPTSATTSTNTPTTTTTTGRECTLSDYGSIYTECSSPKDLRRVVYYKKTNCTGGVPLPVSQEEFPCSK